MEAQRLPDMEAPWREFVEGWAAFANAPFMVQEFLSLLIAAALGSVIARLPRRPTPATAAEWERPNTLVLYAIVGAVVAELVLFNPPMAFVVFGIGGLLRFRSVIGSARDTARTILAAVVGLACGLKLFPVAALATAFYAVGALLLQSRAPHRLEVRKLDREQMDAAPAAWRVALETRGCRIPSLRTVTTKGRIEMLVLVPATVDPDGLLESLDLPAECKGSPSWLSD